MTGYAGFIRGKAVVEHDHGFTPHDNAVFPLFPHQEWLVDWACRRGRAAVFADTGLGKTRVQLAWAHHVHRHTGRRVLILAPLAVAAQTVREAHRIGVDACVSRDGDGGAPILVTNYERLHHFQSHHFAGLVLDESSILKAYTGTTRRAIQSFADHVTYRLACTATPAPNDLLEITNHSVFVGGLDGREVISTFFIGDDDQGSKRHYRLKRHAERAFHEWMNSWAAACRKPSDLDPLFPDDGYVLEPTLEALHMVDAGHAGPHHEGQLFALPAATLTERRAAMRDHAGARCEVAAGLVHAEPGEQWLVWCHLNREADELHRLLPDAVEIRGSDPLEAKEEALLGFADGTVRTLITKPSIAGHGMNFQGCARMVFASASDSFEQRYQAVRRCQRFGQDRRVHVHTIASTAEQAVIDNLERKHREARAMMDGMIDAMGRLRFGRDFRGKPDPETREGEGWRLMLGDSAERLTELDPDSVGMSIFSPPFPGMYLYSNTPHDVGNARTLDELVEHLAFICGDPLMRVTMPGRMACLHLMQLPAYKTRDDYAGIIDFRGRTIQMMTANGWHYAGEVTIDKNPQVQATRHKEHGLLFKTIATDSSHMRMALADYLLYFRKPGENPEPIHAGSHPIYNAGAGWITQAEWIEWAHPVWLAAHRQEGGIKETAVLDPGVGRDGGDERHLCPLQLPVIERAVKLWSNPGDVVLSPFAGIGSEGVVALQHGRRFIGCELKESYFRQACRNLAAVSDQLTLEVAS